MILEKAQHNWRIFRATTLVAIACSPLFVALPSYAQAANNKETTMAQANTPHLHGVPQAPTAEIRPFHVNFPEEQLADLRGHNLPQEAPHAFAQAVIDVNGFAR